MKKHLKNKGLNEFLVEQCKARGLSLRALSIKADLSPGTVHSIINRQYQPTLFSLNRLADYLGVKREYLWQLGGLLEDMDYSAGTTFGDPQLRFYFARVDKLPRPARELIMGIIDEFVAYIETGGTESNFERPQAEESTKSPPET